MAFNAPNKYRIRKGAFARMIRRTLKLRRLRRDIRGLFRLWAVMKMSARWSEKAEIFEAKHNAACREYNRTRFCFMRRRRLIGEPARDERKVRR